MTTTVQTQKTPFYSDDSGYFYAGLKREDTKNWSMFKKLIYNTDSKTVFDRVDTNGDSVLQKDEITYEILNDIDSKQKRINSSVYLGIGNLGLSYIIRKHSPKISKLGLAVAIYDTGEAIYNIIQKKKLQKRIANGAN